MAWRTSGLRVAPQEIILLTFQIAGYKVNLMNMRSVVLYQEPTIHGVILGCVCSLSLQINIF